MAGGRPVLEGWSRVGLIGLGVLPSRRIAQPCADPPGVTGWWALWDSNPGLPGYEPGALTS